MSGEQSQMGDSAPGKLWGGRFTGSLDPLMTEYNQSIYYDRAFYHQDIAGSIAWARANHKAGIISTEELQKIVKGLEGVEKEWVDGTFEILPGVDEVPQLLLLVAAHTHPTQDIHTANERRLSEKIGKDIGGKLHTGYGVRHSHQRHWLESDDECQALPK